MIEFKIGKGKQVKDKNRFQSSIQITSNEVRGKTHCYCVLTIRVTSLTGLYVYRKYNFRAEYKSITHLK